MIIPNNCKQKSKYERVEGVTAKCDDAQPENVCTSYTY